MTPHLDMLEHFRSVGPTQSVPGISELTEHLHERMAAVGDAAFQEFSYLQQVAAQIWGPEQTSHFAIVLRKARVAPKAARVSRWKIANTAIDRLPAQWQSPLRAIAARSEAGTISAGLPTWSADYLGAVTSALGRYVDYAVHHGAAIVPPGADLHSYALWLTDPENTQHGVSVRAAADYLSRIKAGLSLIEPSMASPAREFVCRYWREKGRAGGTPTKTGDQLVGAGAIYDLGFRQIEEARSKSMRGVRAATIFRNGLILVFGTALPQRARAISALEAGTTLWFEQPDRLHVRIPARMLKRREDQKTGDPFDIVWHNARLVARWKSMNSATVRSSTEVSVCFLPFMRLDNRSAKIGSDNCPPKSPRRNSVCAFPSIDCGTTWALMLRRIWSAAVSRPRHCSTMPTSAPATTTTIRPAQKRLPNSVSSSTVAAPHRRISCCDRGAEHLPPVAANHRNFRYFRIELKTRWLHPHGMEWTRSQLLPRPAATSLSHRVFKHVLSTCLCPSHADLEMNVRSFVCGPCWSAPLG